MLANWSVAHRETTGLVRSGELWLRLSLNRLRISGAGRGVCRKAWSTARCSRTCWSRSACCASACIGSATRRPASSRTRAPSDTSSPTRPPTSDYSPPTRCIHRDYRNWSRLRPALPIVRSVASGRPSYYSNCGCVDRPVWKFSPNCLQKLAQFNMPAEFTLGYRPNSVVRARVVANVGDSLRRLSSLHRIYNSVGGSLVVLIHRVTMTYCRSISTPAGFRFCDVTSSNVHHL